MITERQLHQLVGDRARKAGSDFEERIAASLDAYIQAGRGFLDFLPIPMVPSGQRGFHGEPLYRPGGPAPFDVFGYEIVEGKAIFSCIELKCTSNRETSLAIIQPEKNGSGLQYHQLAALAMAVHSGGYARVVWDNGGEVGVLSGEAIVVAEAIYSQSLACQMSGRDGPVPAGTRSMSWDKFRPVGYASVANQMVLGILE